MSQPRTPSAHRCYIWHLQLMLRAWRRCLQCWLLVRPRHARGHKMLMRWSLLRKQTVSPAPRPRFCQQAAALRSPHPQPPGPHWVPCARWRVLSEAPPWAVVVGAASLWALQLLLKRRGARTRPLTLGLTRPPAHHQQPRSLRVCVRGVRAGVRRSVPRRVKAPPPPQPSPSPPSLQSSTCALTTPSATPAPWCSWWARTARACWPKCLQPLPLYSSPWSRPTSEPLQTEPCGTPS